jgi:flagellar basal body-associated protein FliL
MAEESPKSVPVPRRRRAVVLLIPVLLLVVVGAWFWFSRNSAAEPSADTATQVKSTLHLDTFVLNLADSDERSYLRVGVDLGLGAEPKRGEESAPVAEVRDTILGVLAQAKAEELLSAEGKTKLKESLLHALQERMPQLEVQEVYFTEFLIQR